MDTWLSDRPGSAVDVSDEPTGHGFVSGGDEHANALQLQLRLLPSGVVGQDGHCDAVAAQEARDEFRLHAAADDRHRHWCAVHHHDVTGRRSDR